MIPDACHAGGFARTVAIERLHPHLTHDPDFVTMFLDEERIMSRWREEAECGS